MLVENSSRNKTTLLFLALQYFDGIRGRTRLQKLLYLTDAIGWNAMPDYRYYHHGPYSQWLQVELESLVQSEILEEEEVDLGDGRTLYDYYLTDDGRGYLERTIDVFDNQDLVEQTRRFFEMSGAFSTEDLEVMATLVFMKRTSPNSTNEELVGLVHRYKPQFTIEFIRHNLRVFDILEEFPST